LALDLRRAKLSNIKRDLDKSAIKNRTARISGKVLVKDAVKLSGKLRLLRVQDILYSWSTKYSEKTRKYDINLGSRRIQETRLVIKLPKGAVINQLPPKLSLSAPGLLYELEWTRDGENLNIQRKYRRDKRFFPASTYLKVQEFYNQILEAEAKAVVIR
jgi:hypothetical protein